MGVLQGRVAIVTGGSAGLGEATAELFAAEGAHVVIAGASDLGEKVAERLGIAFIKTDVSRSIEVDNLVDQVAQRFGRLDIMVNNAGVTNIATIVNETDEDFDRLVGINLGGVFYGTRAAGRVMKKQGKGAIVNISSIAGILPVPGSTVYSATKAAVVSLTQGAAVELAPFGVRVNAIAPGIFPTSMHAKAGLNKAQKAALSSLQPIGRVGFPKELAEGVLYLASDRSSFVVGHHLVIDGGASVGNAIKNN